MGRFKTERTNFYGTQFEVMNENNMMITNKISNRSCISTAAGIHNTPINTARTLNKCKMDEINNMIKNVTKRTTSSLCSKPVSLN